jgi:hypothetical protein
MKKLITSILLVNALLGFSQMVVNDPGANAALTSQLATSAQQLKQLEESYSILQKNAERLDKVTSVISSINNIEQIIAYQKEATGNVQLIMKNSKGNNTIIFRSMNKVLQDISKNVNLINKVLKGGFFSMSDKERIDYFDNIKRDIIFNLGKTRMYSAKYKK